jgi:organic hydroperoxide reductase OsmC/OhrA
MSAMEPYPHVYEATANGAASGEVRVSAPRLEVLRTAPPAEFGGPGDRWSPETLLVAAIADCFVLTLRALARAAGFDWRNVECRVEGVLERTAGVTRFTRIVTRVALTVPPGADEAAARGLLERAEKGCLIGNSLQAARILETTIFVAQDATAVPHTPQNSIGAHGP